MLKTLIEKNPSLKFYSVKDPAFKKYGRVIDMDASEIVAACKKMTYPESGSQYIASVKELENLNCSQRIMDETFGSLDAQIGICHGYNTTMNALEYHKSSEINVAVTPLVLILGLEQDMDGFEYDSSKAEAFYLEEGDVVEVYATSLHYCPCQVSDSGFSSVVGLPKNTNTPLERKIETDRLLFSRNKWLICHDTNENLLARGIHGGLHGENYTVKY